MCNTLGVWGSITSVALWAKDPFSPCKCVSPNYSVDYYSPVSFISRSISILWTTIPNAGNHAQRSFSYLSGSNAPRWYWPKVRKSAVAWLTEASVCDCRRWRHLLLPSHFSRDVSYLPFASAQHMLASTCNSRLKILLQDFRVKLTPGSLGWSPKNFM